MNERKQILPQTKSILLYSSGHSSTPRRAQFSIQLSRYLKIAKEIKLTGSNND